MKKRTVSKNTAAKSFKPGKAELETAPRRAKNILQVLYKAYPDAKCALHHKNALELLIATILSAQCTDVRVNIVTKDLFKKYRKALDYAQVEQAELEQDIKTTGFYRNKAKNIQSACRDIAAQHKGKVPDNMAELVALAGVGRKTANVILGNAYGVPGITTDTHVIRLSRLMGLSKNSDPVKLEYDLMELIPKKDWTQFSHMMIWHGRRICGARKPDCENCPVQSYCCFGILTLK